jgi:hypothetical protein
MRAAIVAVAVSSATLAACGASSGTIDAEHLYTRFACDAGTADCDGLFSTGCETDLHARENCGACGVTCGEGQICAVGTCMAP